MCFLLPPLTVAPILIQCSAFWGAPLKVNVFIVNFTEKVTVISSLLCKIIRNIPRVWIISYSNTFIYISTRLYPWSPQILILTDKQKKGSSNCGVYKINTNLVCKQVFISARKWAVCVVINIRDRRSYINIRNVLFSGISKHC